jgi:signal transduction protein with GAF and PtsI domain
MRTLTSVEKSQLTQFRKRLLKEIEAVRTENQAALRAMRMNAGRLRTEIGNLDQTEVLRTLSASKDAADAAVVRMQQAEENAQPMCDKIYAHFDRKMHDEMRIVFESQRKEPWFLKAIDKAVTDCTLLERARPWWKFW